MEPALWGLTFPFSQKSSYSLELLGSEIGCSVSREGPGR